MTHLAEKSEPCFVLRGTSTRSRVFPVQVQTIKPMSPQKPDGRLDECLPVGCGGHHDGEPEEMCLSLNKKNVDKIHLSVINISLFFPNLSHILRCSTY